MTSSVLLASFQTTILSFKRTLLFRLSWQYYLLAGARGLARREFH